LAGSPIGFGFDDGRGARMAQRLNAFSTFTEARVAGRDWKLGFAAMRS
jgi:hypothetical protein